jgi:hypothetical protein
MKGRDGRRARMRAHARSITVVPKGVALRLAIALLTVTAAVAAPAVAGAAPNKPFKVTSTLDGRTVLPHRLHWSGFTTLASTEVKRVDFLVDGRVAWSELQAPYTFADDRGYLVTSWIKPGVHLFSVRVTSVDGRRGSDTVRARVLPPAAIPAPLIGAWKRTIPDTSGAPAAGSAGNPTSTLVPPGTYQITFDPRWIHDEFPCTNSPCTYNSDTGAGGEFDTDWIPGPRTFSVLGSVTFHTFEDTDRLAGWWCETWGPAATYTWSVSGATLTLAPTGGHDACAIRGFIWAGTWTKAE